MSNDFTDIYRTLREAFGHQEWWPARTPFEVMVGAILTQNTNWNNVETAIENLREAGLLQPGALCNTQLEELQMLIRPAGYYRQKAARLLRLARWVKERCGPADCRLKALQTRPLDELRVELLQINGIGPETADSILLYALEKPVFVIDAYTVRIFGRHELIEPGVPYAELQEEFQHRLPEDVELYKDFHAQLVEVGKRFCSKTSPACSQCPLRPQLGPPVLGEL
jgi:endonuclease-3 related protein